jgi:protein-tyrosine kinase
MSKFFKALEEAERERALRSGSSADAVRIHQSAVPESPVPVAVVPRPGVPRPGVPRPAVPGPMVRPDEETARRPGPVSTPLDGVDERLVSLVMPAAFEAEQYRGLRHIVEQLHRASGLKVLAVSSPRVGDGKTLTAINLAGALAQGPEARVLLIDADLRRPSVGRLLGFPESGGPGLVSAIQEPRVALDQIVQPRPPFNLSVVCAGATPASPYDVLKSPRLGELLDEARHFYDYIVLDTPPLTPVQDCRVIGRWVDGFLLVVAAQRTPRRLVEEALAVLDRAKILGCVFNDEQDHSISSYDSRYYGGYLAPSQPLLNGHAGPLRRVLSNIGDSLLRRGTRSRPPNDGRRGGPR